jgi:hypothetical protein
MTAAPPSAPTLHFTGRADLIASFARHRMDAFRARCNLRVDHDAQARIRSIGKAFLSPPNPTGKHPRTLTVAGGRPQ